MSTSTSRAAHPVMARVFDALLYLYPGSFREEFGPAVHELAVRELDAARNRGRLAAAGAMVAQTFDIVLSALRQRVFGRAHASDGGVLRGWSAWVRDAKYGARLLAKQRTFSAVVIITLGLAIGANTVIFTFTNILLVRGLPVREPKTLGWIFNSGPGESDRSRSSLADLLDYRASLRSFTAISGHRQTKFTLTRQGDAERLNGLEVTANLFDVWGLTPLAGRFFHAGEDARGAAPVVALAHQFWQRRFAADPSIVGRSLVIDGVSRVVVGIVGPAIEIGSMSTVDVWTPLAVDPAGAEAGRAERRIGLVGRLAPGVSHEQATVEIHAVAQRLQQEHPQTNAGWDARVAQTREATTGNQTWLVLALLVLVVTFVLLIACANLANLMLARSADRAREIAVRTALGASRAQIIRQLLVESILLGVVGGAFGLALAYGGTALIKAYAYEEFFRLLTIDRNVLAFATIVTLVTSVAFSLVPAITASGSDVAELLKSGSGKASGGVRARRGRAFLVGSQVALALSLTVVAALIVRSEVETARINIGFDPHGMFAFRVDVPTSRYPETDRLPLLYEKILSELAVPGVSDIALSSRLPVIDGDAALPIVVEGRPSTGPNDHPWAAPVFVSERFAATTRIPILGGRFFAHTDGQHAPRVAVVNREMARRYWGSPAAALGRRVAIGGGKEVEWMTIVGVSGDTRPDDITQPPSPQVYAPIVQVPTRSIVVLMRATNAAALLPDIRAAIRRVDDNLALYDARTVDETFRMEMSTNYVLIGMYMSFAAIALALAAAGLYGVISYSVSQRTREIGIRVALGASPRDVRRLVLLQGVRMLVLGGVAGIVLAGLIARAIHSLLYGVSPLDPTSHLAVIGLIAAVMGIATWVPARRATRVDPIRALHSD